MNDFASAIVLGIFEMLLVILAAVVFGVLWCCGLALFAGGRYGLGVLRVGRRLVRRRATDRELAAVVLECQRATQDVRAVSQAARREIRKLAERRRA
jgi:hypothetical protein